MKRTSYLWRSDEEGRAMESGRRNRCARSLLLQSFFRAFFRAFGLAICGLVLAGFGACADREPGPAETTNALDSCANTSDGAHCSDGNPCTDDVCFAHHCVGTPVADGMTCTDGDPCTKPDMCQKGQCVPGPVLADGESCDEGDLCHPNASCQAGFCIPGSELSCDDGLACTLDSCDLTKGCVSAPNPVCVDGAVPDGAGFDGSVADSGTPDASPQEGGTGNDANRPDAKDTGSGGSDAADTGSTSDTRPDNGGGLEDGGLLDARGGRGGASDSGLGGQGGEAPGGRGPVYTAKGGACSCSTEGDGELSWGALLVACACLSRRRRAAPTYTS